MLDKRSAIPVYYQLKLHIQEEIKKQNLKPGDAIPTEKEYCERFGISRMTVRQALKELEQEGVITRHKGRGSFVNMPRIEQVGFMSFSKMVKDRGMRPETELIKFKKRTAADLADKLKTAPEEQIWEIVRLRKADGFPVALESVFIPAKYVPGLEAADLTGSWYELLRTKYGLDLKCSRTEFSATMSTPQLNKLLQLEKGMPLLQTENLVFGKGPVYYEKSFYRSDKFTITVDLH